MINAFLLTRQSIDTRDGVKLEFWFSSKYGPLKVIITDHDVLFFISQKDVNQVKSLFSDSDYVKINSLNLKNFESELMAGIYFKTQQQLYRTRDILQNAGVRCLESDIRPTDRFLTERFLTGPVAISIDDVSSVAINPKITPTEYHPDFKVMSFDIETDYSTNQLYSIAFVTTNLKKVLMVDETRLEDNNESDNSLEFFNNESSLLIRFLDLIDKIDPDVFIGWNVVQFDFRFLQKKCDDLGIPLTMGRQQSRISWRQQQRASSDRYFLFIPGRIVLDGIETLRGATYSFSNFSLNTVAFELLGRGKLIHDDVGYDPLFKAKEIQRQFREEKTTLAAYNLEDCQLVWDIFEHTDLLNGVIERARLTGLEMDRVGGSVAAFDNLYLPRLHRKGYVAPNIGDYEGRLSAPGGYVMDSVPGMHESVLVLDYKSLYPSIILTFKVDPYAKIAAQSENEDNTIPGYDGISFSKTEHILPDIIRNLWDARDQAKKEKNSALSQEIKIIMNSFYGVLGTQGCRLHDSRLTSSITKRSHDVILQTVKNIEATGYSVIYGDTDSVFVALGGQFNNLEAKKIGENLVQSINMYWREELKKKYGIDSYLEMEFETHFIRFFMPTIRGSDKGSKKRYAGMVKNERGEKEIIFKGLETVRTDWTKLAKDFQRELYDRVFNGVAYENYVRRIVVELKAGQHDNKLIYRKRLRQRLSEYKKNIPPHAQAGIKAERYFRENKLPSRYQQKNWIEYVITLNGPETLECQTSTLNYEHYIEKQLTPIADTILSTMGGSMIAIIQDQYEMF